MHLDPALLEYAKTERQREVLTSLLETGSKRETARKLGIDPHHVRKVVRAAEIEAARKGYSPQHNLNHPLPAHLQLSGTTTLYDKRNGVEVLQWVKSGLDRESLHQLMLAAAEAVTSTIVPDPPVKAPKQTLDDLMSCYILTDYHMGLLAWHAEGGPGGDWDLGIAEQVIYDWAAQAIGLGPQSKRAVLAQLGDFLHYDTLESLTPKNKNPLDSDSRYPKMVEASVRALRRIIRSLLSHHEEVIVLMAEGNHDPVSSVWLRELFTSLYEDEPRVTVERSPLPYYAVEHGRTSVFFHHGHLRKPREISEVFASQFREMLGRTEFSYGHMGHMHHALVHETPLMIIEQHPTLAAKSSYDSRGGWSSQRSAPVIVYDRNHGEVGRIRVPISMVAA
jgi:hypothetical protein